MWESIAGQCRRQSQIEMAQKNVSVKNVWNLWVSKLFGTAFLIKVERDRKYIIDTVLNGLSRLEYRVCLS
jgi:hypothetical protein